MEAIPSRYPIILERLCVIAFLLDNVLPKCTFQILCHLKSIFSLSTFCAYPEQCETWKSSAKITAKLECKSSAKRVWKWIWESELKCNHHAICTHFVLHNTNFALNAQNALFFHILHSLNYFALKALEILLCHTLHSVHSLYQFCTQC